MPERLTITVTENGPYKVENARTIDFGEDELDIDGAVWLCRCGQSKNPPFCDGTHNSVDFVGTSEPKPLKEVVNWEGRTVRTRFDPNICMHALVCKKLDAARERELAGDDDAAQVIMRTVLRCPSGALTFETKDTDEPTVLNSADIEIAEGGEIAVQRSFDINVARPEGAPDSRCTLCRCGQSKNKPFCDGRHKSLKNFR